MKPQTKNFDLGLYTFSRKVMGSLCPEDDQKMKNGTVVALLHPLQSVDPAGLYCFAVDKESGDTKTLVRKNLKFNKIVTLKLNVDEPMTAHEMVWAKLNKALAYLQESSKTEELSFG